MVPTPKKRRIPGGMRPYKFPLISMNRMKGISKTALHEKITDYEEDEEGEDM